LSARKTSSCSALLTTSRTRSGISGSFKSIACLGWRSLSFIGKPLSVRKCRPNPRPQTSCPNQWGRAVGVAKPHACPACSARLSGVRGADGNKKTWERLAYPSRFDSGRQRSSPSDWLTYRQRRSCGQASC
jgi:hypothetical protein